MMINLREEDRPFSTFETCHYGMKAIFEHNTNLDLHHKKVIADLKDHRFEIEKITLVKVKDDFHCDVVAKDKKGFRSYAVVLEKNAKFQHLYRIFDVRGVKLVSSYQWKDIKGGIK